MIHLVRMMLLAVLAYLLGGLGPSESLLLGFGRCRGRRPVAVL